MGSNIERRWTAWALAPLLVIAMLGAGCGDSTEPGSSSNAVEQGQGTDAAAAARAERAQLRRERRQLRRQRAELRRERVQIRRERAHARRVAAARRERKREIAAAAAAAAAAEPAPAPEPATASCHPSYDPCLKPDSSDYDCTGGSGDGPDYTGFVTVSGPDDYGLDSDSDGTGCES
jgi:hypothetical protein